MARFNIGDIVEGHSMGTRWDGVRLKVGNINGGLDQIVDGIITYMPPTAIDTPTYRVGKSVSFYADKCRIIGEETPRPRKKIKIFAEKGWGPREN